MDVTVVKFSQPLVSIVYVNFWLDLLYIFVRRKPPDFDG